MFVPVGVVVRGFRHTAGLHARVILNGAACRLGELGNVRDVLGCSSRSCVVETSHKQRWDPTVCQDTADDDDNDTSCQMPALCWAKESLTPKKTQWNVPSTDVIAVTRKKSNNTQKNKNSQAALL